MFYCNAITDVCPYVVSNSGGLVDIDKISASGFALAFGLTIKATVNLETVPIELSVYSGITTIFIMLLIAIILCIILYRKLEGDFNSIPDPFVYVLTTIVSLVVSILIVCSVSIVAKGQATSRDHLGWGAISGGIIGLFATLMLAYLSYNSIIAYNRKRDEEIRKRLNCYRSNETRIATSNEAYQTLNKTEQRRSLEERILEIKNLYDKGLISEEQYERKKEDILFKEDM